jgi:tetratricopeptide (TPR) repeat protein
LRWLAVNPLVPDPHRFAATAAEHLDDHALAFDSYEALLAQDPFDLADIHYRLASALNRAGDVARAKKHALLALEQTPRYREAQRLLLEIVDKHEARATPAPPGAPPTTADKPSTPPATETPK